MSHPFITCIPLWTVVHFCIECDAERAFDSNAHCWVCGCDSPGIPVNEDDMTIDEYEKYWDLNNPQIWIR